MSEKENKESKFSDVIKKVVSTGIGAAFMTEEAVKQMVSEIPLPKEFLNSLVQNAKNTKDDVVNTIKTELKTRLDKLDVTKEIDKILENYDLEVNAKISFKKKEKSDKK